MSEQDKTMPMDEQTTAPADPVAEAEQPSANGAAEATPTTDQEMSVQEQLVAERAKAAEYLDNWQRSHAEFANYRRRTENERAETVTFATIELITKLLPVLDDLDLALANVPAEQRDTAWVEGVTLIQRKLQRLFETEGVTPIEALDQPFDPHLHEAVAVEDDASEPHVVVAELRKGYRLRERVLRPALVRVGNARTRH